MNMIVNLIPTFLIAYIVLSNHYMISTSGEVANFFANDINILRDRGKSCLTTKNFRKAAQYYSAILQIIEKDKQNEKSDSLRRRCALTLAECEIQSGNWHHAIARCSEIIDEYSTNFNSNNDELNIDSKSSLNDLREALGKAFYRRGVSLLNLNKTVLAYLDFNVSMEYIPDNQNVYDKISSIKMIIDINSEEIQLENKEDELRDLVEECQYNYPRTSFTKKQINKLTSKSKQNVNINTNNQLVESDNRNNDFENEVNPFDNISNLFGGLGNSEGLPSFGLGSAGGGGMSNIPLLLTTFAGVDPKKAKLIGDVIQAVSLTFNKFQSGYKLIVKNQKIIIVILTIVWIAVSLFVPLVNKIK